MHYKELNRKEQHIMKKILFAILVMIFSGAYTLQAQDHLEIKAESASKALNANPEDALVITVQGDFPGYTVMLFKKEPWKGAKAIETIKNSYETIYRFQDLKPGDYHVCVLDAKENMDCQKVSVKRR